MKTFLRITTGTLFCISFLCMLAYGGNTAAQQFVWTFGWMAVCAVSGHYFYTLRKEK